MRQVEAGSDNRQASQTNSHLHVLVVYLLLTLVLTYPVIVQMGTHVPGDGRDDPPLVWNLWWVRHALTELRTNPLASAYMFYPVGVNLTFYTLTILNGLLSIPLQLAANLVVASNANLLLSFVIAAFGMYLLALDVLMQTRSPGARQTVCLAAFLAGLVYAFAPIKMIFASLGQFNMTSTQWLPLCILYLLRTMRPVGEGARTASDGTETSLNRRLVAWLRSDRQGRRNALLAALFLLFTAYAEFTFASFVLIFLGVYLAYLLFTHWRRLASRWMVERLALFGVAFALGLWPILRSMIQEIAAEGDYTLTAGWGFADIFSADLLGFFIPSPLHPILGTWAQHLGRSFTYENFASVGVAVLLLAIAGLAARRRSNGGHATAPAGFWGMSALVFAVLSLGPVLHISGRWVFDLDGLLVRLPLPFIILHYLPVIKANRYPSRLQVMVILCLAVLVAYGAAALFERIRASGRWRSWHVGARPLAAILSAAIVFEYLAVPLPMSDMRVPEVYRRIAADNGNAPLLQLPLSWRNSFQFIPQSFTALPQSTSTVVMFEQFYQTVHQGPILSGNTSRNPAFKLTYFLQAPVIRSIIALEEGRAVSQEQVASDRLLASDALRLLGFKYIVLHPPLVGGPVEDYVRAVFPVEAIPADAGLSAYRIMAPAPASQTVIDMGSDLSNLYCAEGWGEVQEINGQMARWSDRAQARLLIPLAQPGPIHVTIALAGHAPGRIIDVLLNGQRLLRTQISESWSDLQIDAPAAATRSGINDLLIVSALESTAGAARETLPVGQTGVATGANIVVQSAGLDAGGDGGLAHVYVNFRDAIIGRRGFNVVQIEPAGGNVERTANFDVLGDPAADTRFLDWVKAVPDGRIVAVAVMDDASVNAGEGSAAALRLIGAGADVRGKFRYSYAALGVKGAAPGTALEQMIQGRPASAGVGAQVYGKGIGVAVSRVTVETRE